MNMHHSLKASLLIALSSMTGVVLADGQAAGQLTPALPITTPQETPAPVTSAVQSTPVVDLVPKGGSADTLSDLQIKASILKAKLEIAKLEQSITEAKYGSAGAPTQPSMTPAVPSIQGSSTSSAVIQPQSLPGMTKPTVLMISGVGDAFTARIRLPDGGTVTAHNGQILDKGVRVVRINSNDVLMNFHGVEKRLYVNDGSSDRSIVNPQMLTAIPYGSNPVSPAITSGQPPVGPQY